MVVAITPLATVEVTKAKPIYSTVFQELSYHTGIPTHDHVVNPRGGVRGVIPSKQGY